MKIWKRQSKNPREKVCNYKIRQKGRKVKIKKKTNFMKRKRNKKFKKKTHLTSNIMIIKKCSEHKFNRIYNLKNKTIRNSCSVFKIKIYKEVRYINMEKIHQDHHSNQMINKTLILVLILIILKIKKVLLKNWNKWNLRILKVIKWIKK